MASSSKQSDPRELIPLPKFSPGPKASFFGWALQVEAILKLPGATDEVKRASILNAIPADILTKVFQKNGLNLYCYHWHKWLHFLEALGSHFQDPNTEIEYYNSLQAPTKTDPL